MKKKVLLSSVLTIALCLSLIAGSTYALFTSKSEVNISVTAGEVDMVAGIEITKVESVQGDVNGTIVDENGGTYSYSYSDEEGPEYNFINGGSAVVDGALLTMDKVTPGDKVTFAVSGKNNSNVAIQYRYIIECTDGYKLMSGMVVSVNGGDGLESMASYTSPWSTLGVGENIAPVSVSIELPVDAGNEYQTLNTTIRVVVEAVQGNAVVEDNVDPIIVPIMVATTAEELEAALTNPDVPAVNIIADISEKMVIDYDLSNKTIMANGNDVAFDFNGTLENVVVSGVVSEGAKRSIDIVGATGDITIVDSTLISAAGTSGSAIGHGPNVNVTVDNCKLVSGGGKTYGMYYSGSSGSLIITNSTFEGFGSWAITSNGTINGDVVIDNCTFNTPDGVFKTLGGGVTGNFTFTNNTMIGCKGHDGKINQLVVSGSGNGPVICAGTKTVSGNTLDGVEWTQE